MDFIKPSTIWIRGACYRTLNHPTVSSTTHYIEDDLYPEEDTTYQDELDCGKIDIPVEQLKNGRYATSLQVANMYFPIIIGSKGTTRKRIESDTSTQIRIPAKGQSGDIVIQGMNVKSVRAARLKVELLVDKARKKQPFTHFISLPIISSNVQEGFLKFKTEVLESCGDCRGIHESLFQSCGKLHLTLCVMMLADDRERHQIVDVIEQCYSTLVCDSKDLEVEMCGVEYMNDDPGEVDVLYGKVSCLTQGLHLQDMVDKFVDDLIQAGAIQRQYERVKLHVTLMNTLFRQEADNPVAIENGTKRQRESFDARRILENFENFYFGKSKISELHLSVRFTTSSSGYYTATKVFNLSAL